MSTENDEMIKRKRKKESCGTAGERIHGEIGGNKIPFVAGARWTMSLFHPIY